MLLSMKGSLLALNIGDPPVPQPKVSSPILILLFVIIFHLCSLRIYCRPIKSEKSIHNNKHHILGDPIKILFGYRPINMGRVLGL